MGNEETEAQRRAYLDAMGIQHWEATTAAEPPPAAESLSMAPARPMTKATPPAAPPTMQHATQAITRQVPPGPTHAAPVSQAVSDIPVPAETGDISISSPPAPAPPPGLQPSAPLAEPPGDLVSRLDWPELEQAVHACTACDLHRTRTQTVFGVGNREADWMIVGEAPGADEDRLGEPFVGRAGKLLDAMLQAIGLQRQQVYIGNILKCRPPRNRDPESAEIARCRPFLDRQIDLIQPRLILALGRIASQTLLQTTTAMRDLRGRPHQYRGIPVVVTYHPAYLLRSPREKRKVWQDLQSACREMAKQQ